MIDTRQEVMSQGVLDDGTDSLFSMEPLFHHGVPSSESLEAMLRQLDQHLHDNSKRSVIMSLFSYIDTTTTLTNIDSCTSDTKRPAPVLQRILRQNVIVSPIF